MTSIEANAPATAGRTYTYVMDKDWGKLPDGWVLDDAAAVAVDSQDRVYVFNRGKHPMIVFDREGRFLRSWGEGLFKRAHGLHIGPDDTLWCTDDGDHTVRQCTTEGKVLLEIGLPNKPAPYMSGRPFNRCTHTALSPQGDIFVSDGYGNARVHKYSPNGKHLMSWGESGTGPGEFNIVHNITCDDDGWVYVADRENHRVQVFNGAGRYETQWNNLHRPCGLCMTRGKRPVCYVGELGPGMPVNKDAPNIGPRLSVLSQDGKLIGRVNNADLGSGMDPFKAPHGVAIDSRGDLYIGEVSFTGWRRDHPGEPPPPELRSLRKLVRKPG
jgi:DNA-binding beta-propeller fold protein YncE